MEWMNPEELAQLMPRAPAARRALDGDAPRDGARQEPVRVTKRSGVPVALVAGTATITAACLLLACGRRSVELPVLWPAPEFALINQRGDTLRSADLEGSVWVASFVFTNCTGVCPTITAKMAQLRGTLDVGGPADSAVRLVSITVDPARDTPEVLSRYAERFGGSPPERWAFLTGSSPEDVRRLIQEGFRLGAVLDTTMAGHEHTNYQVQHTPRLALVDREGMVRGTYSAVEPAAYDQLLADVQTLVD